MYLIYFMRCVVGIEEHTEFPVYKTPELLDRTVDVGHRSYDSTVRGLNLGTFRARVPLATMPLDPRWVPRFDFKYIEITNILQMIDSDLD